MSFPVVSTFTWYKERIISEKPTIHLLPEGSSQAPGSPWTGTKLQVALLKPSDSPLQFPPKNKEKKGKKKIIHKGEGKRVGKVLAESSWVGKWERKAKPGRLWLFPRALSAALLLPAPGRIGRSGRLILVPFRLSVNPRSHRSSACFPGRGARSRRAAARPLSGAQPRRRCCKGAVSSAAHPEQLLSQEFGATCNELTVQKEPSKIIIIYIYIYFF